MQQAGRDAPAFGFLTTIDSAAHGLFGGYLVVDALGRPLEFHCTAPVKVSRAQQILYGPTLQGHLVGRQVGGALLAEGKATPAVVLTDSEAMLHVRPHTSLPVALVRRLDEGRPATGFAVGASVVNPHVDDAPRAAEIEARLVTLAEAVDLCEPFERIRAALDEAARH
ncbi:MAG: hypothetical protein FJ284_01975 [Planctomycetes bacterium]|nr:hypothetical protein [Planctomycetota bacterium]